MYTRIKNLKIGNGDFLYYNNLKINHLKKKIDTFLLEKESLNDIRFVKQILFLKEMQDFKEEKIIEQIKDSKDKTEAEKTRLINIIRGYKYIESNQKITKNTLKTLYKILSANLLDDYSKENMGKYYRNREVFILNSSFIECDYDKGIPADKVEEYMESCLNYINQKEELSPIDEFIKSQIIHFYLIYVHPYYDINGRTGRTLATWYLLNQNANPYVIFNRAITYSRDDYKKAIRKSRKKGNLTYFLDYILTSTLKELKKEYLINCIDKAKKLGIDDKQVLQSYLSLNDIPTADNLASFYNDYDSHKSNETVITKLIKPMIEKRIFQITTNYRGQEILSINKKLIKRNEN